MYEEDVIALPKSSLPQRIKSNFDVSFNLIADCWLVYIHVMKFCEQHNNEQIRNNSFTHSRVNANVELECATIMICAYFMYTLQIFDFSLTDEELNEMRALDKGDVGRTFNYLEIFDGLEKHPENPLAAQVQLVKMEAEEVAELPKVECY